MTKKIEHYIRFGSHRESKVFRNNEVKKVINGITINANVLAHSPASIAELLYVNFKKTNYFIDPQTYMIQLDPMEYYTVEKNGVATLKQSVKKLFQVHYKCALTEELEKNLKPLSVKAVSEGLDPFVEKVIDFQLKIFKDYYQKIRKSSGYDDYEDAGEQEDIVPEYIVPPYFYVSIDDATDWLDLNIRAVEKVNKKYASYRNKIAAQLVIDKSILLHDALVKEIHQKYNESPVKTILLWVDSFDECSVSGKFISKLSDFIGGFKDKRIINLYGGGLSLILAKKGKYAGFCHGPGYGESRSVKPVGGGIPTAKYYLPALGRRVDFELAVSVLKAQNNFGSNYFNSVCACQHCKTNLIPMNEDKFAEIYGTYNLSRSGKVEVPSEKTLENNQCHFLLRRNFETMSLDISNLKNSYQKFIKSNSEHKIVSVLHLENWLSQIN